MVVRYDMGWTEMLLIDVPLFAAATLVGVQLLPDQPARGVSATGGRA